MRLATTSVKEFLENIRADKLWYDNTRACKFDTDYEQNIHYLYAVRDSVIFETDEEYYQIYDLLALQDRKQMTAIKRYDY